MAIGTSFVITKKVGVPCEDEDDTTKTEREDRAWSAVANWFQGLMQASERHGFEGEGFSYLKSPVWWGGIVTRTGIPRPSLNVATGQELMD